MSTVFPGRYMADTDAEFVVFLIGMRINRLASIRAWLPVAAAMGPMLRELYAHPEKGFLGAQTLLAWRGVTQVQYWRSYEDLERFARDPNDPHFPAWNAFYRNAGSGRGGAVGIWHETYIVKPGSAEAIYADMPRTGLAAAMHHLRVGPQTGTARKRLEGAAERFRGESRIASEGAAT
jgi:hypothetical protein